MTREQWAYLLLPLSLALNWLLIREELKRMRDDVSAIRKGLEGKTGLIASVTRLEQWAADRGFRRHIPISGGDS